MVEACLAADAQVLVSGDFGHHEGSDSVMQGLAVIDAGHYGLEHIFTEQMRDYLQEQCPNLTVFTEPWSNPFRII